MFAKMAAPMKPSFDSRLTFVFSICICINIIEINVHQYITVYRCCYYPSQFQILFNVSLNIDSIANKGYNTLGVGRY